MRISERIDRSDLVDYEESGSRTRPIEGLRRLGFFEKRSSPDIINLSTGDYYDTPPDVIRAASQAILEGKTKYPPTLGYPELREAVAARIKKEDKVNLDSSNILISPGSDFAIFLAALVLVRPDDDVMVMDPDYAKFEANIRMMGGNPIPIQLKEDGERFRFDPAELDRKLTSKTKMIMFCNPGNPTGIVYSRKELSYLANFAEEHDISILCDEMYRTMVFEQPSNFQSILSHPLAAERTIIVNGFSKAYDMTGFRVGYLVAPKEMISRMLVPFWYSVSSSSSVGQIAALAAITGPQDHLPKAVESYRRRRDLAVRLLREIDGVTCTVPEAGTFAFPKISTLGMTSQVAAEFFLKDAKVALVPGYLFGRNGEGHLRVSYTNPKDEDLEKGLANMRESVARLRKARNG